MRSPECEEHLILDSFWQFEERLKKDRTLKKWTECPFATSVQQILLAEKALWFRFPEPYKLFLLGWNGFNVPCQGQPAGRISLFCCCDFPSDKSPGEAEHPEWGDIVRGNSASYRWPEQPSGLVNFSVDEYGNSYAFGQGAGDERPVVYWDHDGGEVTVIAKDFAEWLNGLPDNLVD